MKPALPSVLVPLPLLLAALAGTARAQIPPGYYSGVDTSSPAALRATLHDAIDDHLRFPYTSGATDTWDILELADEDSTNSGRIIDVYKNASYAKQGGGNSFYNREHTWPKSYGFPNDNPTNYPYTDGHGLFLCDSGYNSARSNKPFRYCNPACAEYPTVANAGAGGVGGGYPGDSNWTSGSFTSGTWETWMGRRGDVARALLYHDIRYEGGTHGITGAAEPDLILTNDQSLIAASQTGSNESVAYMGMLSVLLEWHQQDPVDPREQQRNDTVYSFQGNRNPFVDHPEWVALLHGGTITPMGAAWINELHYDNNGADVGEFVEVAGPANLDLAGYQLVAYNGSNGTVYNTVGLTGVLPDETGCLGTLSFSFTGLQNGAPDAVALVDNVGSVIEFWSYEGTLLATNGPAFGLTSTDMGVAESGTDPPGLSLQRVGTGTLAVDFSWQAPATESPGTSNAGQTFGDACTGPGTTPVVTGLTGFSCAGTVFLDWTDSTTTQLNGYNVYRSTTSGTGYTKLTGTLAAASKYEDSAVASGTTYYYVVTAVDGVTGESPFSTELLQTAQGGGVASGPPWINEFHYDNGGSDVGEFIEVAGPAGLDLAGWKLEGYNGSNGTNYNSVTLSGQLPDEAECLGALAFDFTGLQNGAPDGIALVDPQGSVIEFLSYEGSFTAVGGNASGLTSTDVGVAESFATPAGQSLQRQGTGSQGADFASWAAPQAETKGSVNAGQTFLGGCAGLVETYGCGVNPVGSLTLVSGQPAIGSVLVFGVDNPTGGQTPGSISILALALAPDFKFPCGTLIPGWGMGGPGAVGELLVSTLPGALLPPFVGPAWTGPGSPAQIPFGLPLDCAIAGADLYFQGVIFDPFSATGIGLSEGLHLQVAN